MRKLRKISFLALGLALAGGLTGAFTGKKAATVLAEETWSETLTSKDLTIKYAKAVVANSGADYYTSESGRYSAFVRHGYLTKNKIAKYDKVTSPSNDSCSYSSNTATDSTANHWQWTTGSGKDENGTADGVIVGITANVSFTLSIDETLVTGWPNNGRINYYLMTSGSSTYDLVKQYTSVSTSTSYKLDAFMMNVGDTFYFEYIQLYGGGNIQKLPTFKFGPQVPFTQTINSTTVFSDFYNNGAKTDPTVEFVNEPSTRKFSFGIRHGSILDGNVAKYDNITSTKMSAASDTSNIYSSVTYNKNIFSCNNDGVIIVFKVFEDMSVEMPAMSYAGGWMDNVYISTFLRVNGTGDYIPLSKEYAHTKATIGMPKFALTAGDEFYFEFRFPWDGASSGSRRSIQDNSDTGSVPTFVFSNNNLDDATLEANSFVLRYMKFADTYYTDTQQYTDQNFCVGKNWYSSAKDAFTALSNGAKAIVTADNDTVARLKAWAAANGEEFDPVEGLFTLQARFVLRESEQNNHSSIVIISIVSVLSISALGVLITVKKRKISK